MFLHQHIFFFSFFCCAFSLCLSLCLFFALRPVMFFACFYSSVKIFYEIQKLYTFEYDILRFSPFCMRHTLAPSLSVNARHFHVKNYTCIFVFVLFHAYEYKFVQIENEWKRERITEKESARETERNKWKAIHSFGCNRIYFYAIKL